MSITKKRKASSKKKQKHCQSNKTMQVNVRIPPKIGTFLKKFSEAAGVAQGHILEYLLTYLLEASPAEREKILQTRKRLLIKKVDEETSALISAIESSPALTPPQNNNEDGE